MSGLVRGVRTCQGCQDLSGFVRACQGCQDLSGVSGLVRACQDMSGLVRTCQDLSGVSGLVRACQGLSGLVRGVRTTELYLIYLEIVLQYLVSQKCVTKNMVDFGQIYVIFDITIDLNLW